MFEKMSKSLILQVTTLRAKRATFSFLRFPEPFLPFKNYLRPENSNETFLTNFPQCVPQKYSIFSDFLKDLLRMGWALEVCPLFNLVSCVTLQKMHDIN